MFEFIKPSDFERFLDWRGIDRVCLAVLSKGELERRRRLREQISKLAAIADSDTDSDGPSRQERVAKTWAQMFEENQLERQKEDELEDSEPEMGAPAFENGPELDKSASKKAMAKALEDAHWNWIKSGEIDVDDSYSFDQSSIASNSFAAIADSGLRRSPDGQVKFIIYKNGIRSKLQFNEWSPTGWAVLLDLVEYDGDTLDHIDDVKLEFASTTEDMWEVLGVNRGADYCYKRLKEICKVKYPKDNEQWNKLDFSKKEDSDSESKMWEEVTLGFGASLAMKEAKAREEEEELLCPPEDIDSDNPDPISWCLDNQDSHYDQSTIKPLSSSHEVAMVGKMFSVGPDGLFRYAKKKNKSKRDKQKVAKQKEKSKKIREREEKGDIDITPSIPPLSLSTLSTFSTTNHLPYKNNTSVILHPPSGDLLVRAANADLVVYRFTERGVPYPVLTITPPPNSNPEAATDPHNPQGITFVTTGFLSGGRSEVLGVCVDNGEVRIWNVEDIVKEIKAEKPRDRGFDIDDEELSETDDEGSEGEESESEIHSEIQPIQTSDIQAVQAYVQTDVQTDVTGVTDTHRSPSPRVFIKPRHHWQMGASAWGLDFCSYTRDGKEHNLVAVSDNSCTVTVAYLHKGKTYHVTSYEFIHNVPMVKFATTLIERGRFSHIINCCTIGSEVIKIVFSFMERTESDHPMPYPRPRPHHLTPLDGSEPGKYYPVYFLQPAVYSRIVLSGFCWTVADVNGNCLVSESSLARAFARPIEPRRIRAIEHESKLLGVQVTSDLVGLAGSFQYFPAGSLVRTLTPRRSLLSPDSTYRRIASISRKYNDLLAEFLRPLTVATHEDDVLLLQADGFNCVSSIRALFGARSPIVYTHIIEKLACVICVSRDGELSILRLTHHRGVYGMREEVYQESRGEFRGVCVRERGEGRFWVYVFRNEGGEVYELQKG